jgi:hypothetical protein
MLRVLDDDAVQKWCTERQLRVTDAFYPSFEPVVHNGLFVEYPDSPCRHSTLASDLVCLSDEGNLHDRFEGGLWILLEAGTWDDFGDLATRNFLLQTCGFDPDAEDCRAIEFDTASATEVFTLFFLCTSFRWDFAFIHRAGTIFIVNWHDEFMCIVARDASKLANVAAALQRWSPVQKEKYLVAQGFGY